MEKTPNNPTGTPDADAHNWVDRFAPNSAAPYLRLMRADRPIGTWLLFLPCLWGLGLALAEGNTIPPLSIGLMIALFGLGAFVMRGAGCVYNDIVDRDIDAQVARTASRPIPAGQVSLRRAWLFLIALCLTGLVVLLQFNRFTIMLGLGSLALVAVYPFMKRITYWPQIWLGLTFNWGALVGYAAVTGTLSVTALMIYAGGIFWTLGYDTVYAHQDKEDDALIGVKSTALKLGDATKNWLVVFYGAVIFLFLSAGIVGGFTIFYVIALALAAMHFIWQWRDLDISDGHNCLRLFKSNRDAGALLAFAFFTQMIAALF